MQCWVSFCCPSEWVCVYTYIPFFWLPSHLFRSSWDPEYRSLCNAVGSYIICDKSYVSLVYCWTGSVILVCLIILLELHHFNDCGLMSWSHASHSFKRILTLLTFLFFCIFLRTILLGCLQILLGAISI